MAKKPKTVRVRIAVAVDEKGQYQVDGWDGATDDKVIVAKAIDYLIDPEGCIRVSFIEADVPMPLPQSTTIEGEVSDG